MAPVEGRYLGTYDGRIQHYQFDTPAVAKTVNVNVLLPESYDSGRRYPVLYLLHGGGGDFTEFHLKGDILNLTAGKDLIVVMPDGGITGWYCNPASTSVLWGPRNWETFHMSQLIPWVDATFRTYAEYDGRAVAGYSMGGFGALKYTAKYYGHFASVSSHSGPASLRRDNGRVIKYMNVTSVLESGRPVYGVPWRQDLISADNPVERVESFRNKRIFMVAGTDRSVMFDNRINPPGVDQIEYTLNAVQEQHVSDGQREFGELLTRAGIPHERYEDAGGHVLRPDRMEQDIAGIVERLKKAA